MGFDLMAFAQSICDDGAEPSGGPNAEARETLPAGRIVSLAEWRAKRAGQSFANKYARAREAGGGDV